jgi:hypothetical protein
MWVPLEHNLPPFNLLVGHARDFSKSLPGVRLACLGVAIKQLRIGEVREFQLALLVHVVQTNRRRRI